MEAMKAFEAGPDGRFDAAVIGLGPAGSQCALVLARFGLRVLAVGAEAPHGGTRPGWRGEFGIASRLATEAVEALPASGAATVSGKAEGLEWDSSLPGYSFAVGAFRYRARHVVLATGRLALTDTLAGGLDVDRSAGGRLDVDRAFVTSRSRLYAIGDLADGYAMTVQTALGSGYMAARRVAEAFMAGRRLAA